MENMGQIVVIIIFIIAVVVISMIMRKRQRYHGSGEAADQRNVEDYGTPQKTLYTSAKVLTLHKRIEITDEHDEVVYRAASKVISLHDKTDVEKADGSHVAHIERKIFTLHELHNVTMSDGTKFALSNEIMHIIRDVTNIEGLGWQLNGNILQLNFVLSDVNGDVIAVVGQKLFSVHDKYSVDIYQTQHEEKVVAILIALQHMIRDRAAAAAASSSSSDS